MHHLFIKGELGSSILRHQYTVSHCHTHRHHLSILWTPKQQCTNRCMYSTCGLLGVWLVWGNRLPVQTLPYRWCIPHDVYVQCVCACWLAALSPTLLSLLLSLHSSPTPCHSTHLASRSRSDCHNLSLVHLALRLLWYHNTSFGFLQMARESNWKRAIGREY